MSTVPTDDADLLVSIVDNAGATRTKLIPRRRVAGAASKGIGLSPVFAVMCIDNDITVSPEVSGPAGDMRLLPDLDASAALDDGLAWAPADQYDQDLNPLPLCQRSTARRLVEAAAADGWQYLMAFEIEFTVFRDDGDAVQPAHQGPGYAMTPFLLLEPFLRDLLDDLESAGLEVEQIHPEYGDGQVEVSVAPARPVQTADRYVLARLVITRTALRHGLRVSFAPVTTADGAVGNGAHVHLSAWSDGKNAFTGGTGGFDMTEPGEHLVAGLCAGLAETVGLLAPSVLSYHRLVPGHWSGAWACWGVENREAGIRFVPGTAGHREQAANCEVKVVDGTANPYLVVSGLLAWLRHGLAEKLALPEPVRGDPAALSEASRQRLEVAALPGDLGTALDGFERSAVLREALGDALLDSFLAVRRHELATYAPRSMEETVRELRWRY